MTALKDLPLVRLQGLRHRFQLGGSLIEVLRGVELEVAAGEFIAIMGPSGSGKSTLLHILGGLLRPWQGDYFLGATNVLKCSPRQLAGLRAKRFGLVFQMFHLLPEMSLLQNVLLPFLYNDIPPEQAQAMALDAIARTGLSGRHYHKPGELSGGEMQRAAIARALAPQPDLLLADEPTGNLDGQTGNEILTLFEELHQRGTTIVMVTHDPQVAARAQRTLRMRDGRLS